MKGVVATRNEKMLWTATGKVRDRQGGWKIKNTEDDVGKRKEREREAENSDGEGWTADEETEI